MTELYMLNIGSVSVVLREAISSHLGFHFLISEPDMDHGVGLPSHQVGILQVPGIRSNFIE